ncbi:lipocalin family protein [Gelidibacter sp.]|uniref:lipocalin family protein n=1 Tax=Gelidibacter sp. TaxID=2018083 RepID=UPI002B942871|nr:lipocalin family protein [Gelidibacter sp.]HUH27846.1 lipocalin family protein [Gelidibacter sp.]
MKQFKILTLVLVAMITFNCSSDDDSPAPQPTAHELLMSGKWFIISTTGVTMDDCMKMSYFHFTTQDTLTTEAFKTGEDGKCQSDGTSIVKYTLIENDKKLRMDLGDGDDLIMSIESISAAKLILKSQDLTTTLEKKS